MVLWTNPVQTMTAGRTERLCGNESGALRGVNVFVAVMGNLGYLLAMDLEI